MSRRREKVLHEIGLLVRSSLLFRFHPHHPFATPLLGPIAICRSSLNVARMRKGDQRALFRDEVFRLNVPFIFHDVGPPFIRVLFLDLQQLLPNQCVNFFLAGQDAAQLLNPLYQLQVLLFDLLSFQSSQLIKPKLEYRVNLSVA